MPTSFAGSIPAFLDKCWIFNRKVVNVYGKKNYPYSQIEKESIMKLSSKTYILRFNTNRGKLWQQPQWHQQGSKQSLLRLDTLALKESKFDRRNTQNQNQNSSTGIWLIN